MPNASTAPINDLVDVTIANSNNKHSPCPLKHSICHTYHVFPMSSVGLSPAPKTVAASAAPLCEPSVPPHHCLNPVADASISSPKLPASSDPPHHASCCASRKNAYPSEIGIPANSQIARPCDRETSTSCCSGDLTARPCCSPRRQ